MSTCSSLTSSSLHRLLAGYRCTLGALTTAVLLSATPMAAQAVAAHQHGVAELTLAQDGDQVLVQLDSPMANLVGFEGKPANDEQRAAMQDLKTKLDLPLIAIKDCQLLDMEASYPQADHDDHDGHDDHEEHAHGEHDHDDHNHDEHDHDEHDHDEHDHDEHDHDDHAVHSDLSAHWVFECSTSSLQLSTRLFEYFPGMVTLNLQWSTPQGQGAALWQTDGELTLD